MGSAVKNVVEYRGGTHTHVTVERRRRKKNWLKIQILNHYIVGLRDLVNRYPLRVCSDKGLHHLCNQIEFQQL